MGPTGPQGSRGDKGPEGEKGKEGERGPMGEKGEKGDPAPVMPHSGFSVARSKPLIGNESSPLPVTFDKVSIQVIYVNSKLEEVKGGFYN